MSNESLKNPFPTRHNPQVQGGVFLILMGGIFLLAMSGVTVLGFSPWILMAFLPAFWVGAAAVNAYRHGELMTRHILTMLLFGLMPFAYIFGSSLGINLAAIWPVGLIGMGLIILFARR